MRVVALALAAGVSFGCLGRSAQYSFYTLSPSAGAAIAARPELALVVGPLDLPRYLDRPELVGRDGAHRLVVVETQRWGGSLRNEILRTVADDLASLLDTSRVAVHPAEPRYPARYRVLLDVRELTGALGGEVRLRLRWTIARTTDGIALAMEESDVTRPVAPGGWEQVVAAESEALGAVTRAIAERLAALP